jgi:ABC-type proline/glycine betaine transport system substrate-binding protein
MKARFGLALGTALLVVAAIPTKDGRAAGCDVDRPIIFAGLDWDSNAFHTAVARFILENGYGCETDVIPGSTLPLLTGMARGDIDVTMEIWEDNITEAWTKALAAGQVVGLGTNYPDAVQGWFVPRYLQEGDKERGIAASAPDLRHVMDLPKYKALFTDPEEPDKGRFYNCILGWACEVVNTKKLAVYGLEDSYTNFRPGTGAALAAAIASNYERGKNFVAYYWGPTWVLGKYDLVMLDEPTYDKATWEKMGSEDNPSVATAYPVVKVIVGANKAFADSAKTVVGFLERYETDNAMISAALAFMQNKPGATADDAAHNFLETRKDVWTGWVPADVADRVRAALAGS